MSPLLSRLLALALLAGLLAAGYLFAVVPVQAAFDRVEASIADLRYQLARYTQIAAARPPLEKQMAELEERKPLEGDLVAGTNAALAAATMQELLKAVVTENGGELVSAQALEAEPAGDLERVAMKIELKGDIEALHAILHRIESGKPVLFVDHLELRPLGSRNAEAKLGATKPVALAASLHVAGYRQPEAEAGE